MSISNVSRALADISLEALQTERRRRQEFKDRAISDKSIAGSKERCKTLAGFVREAWHIVEPSNPYVHGWHINAVCDHLEAISFGKITRLLINIPPGPMREDSIVETARGPVPLRNVVIGDLVLTHRGYYRPVLAVHQQGILPILRIVTNSGRVTHAAPSHPYLTPKGWVDARDLKVGDILAVVNRHEDRPNAKGLPDQEARLLGYLVGDGSLTQGTVSFVNGDREVIDDFKRCAAACGFDTSESHRLSHWQVRLLGGAKIKAWLSSHSLEGKSSYTKRIPPLVMAGNKNTLENFIGAFWTCDGGFDVRPTKTRGSRFRAYGTTVSEQLADNLVYALGLLGIESRLRVKRRNLHTAAQPGGIYVSYSVEVQREEMTAQFADMPGLCSSKNHKAKLCQKSFPQSLWDDPIISIEDALPASCMCLTIDGDHSFVCSGLAVKNTMKSLLTSVLWPAWEWGPAGLETMRYFTSSYTEQYVTRDTRRMRDLVMSEWYQERWGDRVQLTRTGESSFSNARTGWREGVPFNSMTGGRGDRVIIDDPHSVETAESDAERKRVIRTFRESVTSRLINPASSAIIIIMQRLHVEDVSGVALSLGLGYEHLCLPMEFEPDRSCETSIGFKDPRTYEGELLFPERFPREVVDRDKAAMGSFAVAGQYQQRPTSREGGLFKEAWLRIVSAAAAGTRWVRYWDLAATAEQLSSSAAYTAGVLQGRQPDGKFVIGDVVRMRVEGQGVRRLIRETAEFDGTNVDIGFSQDPGQAGKVQSQDMISMLAGYRVRSFRETGDKTTRAEPLAAQAEGGNLLLVRGDWNKDFIEEATNFSPAAKFKDQIDAASGGFSMLLGATMLNTPEEQIAIDQSAPVQKYWPRIAGIDVTASTVSVVWVASQPSTETAYIYEAFAVPRREMSFHAQAIVSRGEWIPLMFDMGAKKRSEQEGRALVAQMQQLRLEVFHLPLDMETACMTMNDHFQKSKLRVYSHLTDWFGQYRRLARDEKGQIDDAEAGMLRATGLALMGLPYAITEARAASDAQGYDSDDDTRRSTNPTGY